MLSGLLCLLAALADTDPPECDLFNFPPAYVCEHELRQASVWCAYVEARASFFPTHDHHAARDAANRAWYTWSWLAQAHRNHGVFRRRDLARVRDFLGYDDYYAGRVPSAVAVVAAY